jgi:Protein of unknown function (DUF4197)
MRIKRSESLHGMKTNILQLVTLLLLISPVTQAASFWEKLGFTKPAVPSAPTLTTALSQDEIAAALKQALSKGVENAIAVLGKNDGFLKDVSVKIPMPDQLKVVERGLRAVGQDQLADEFVTTMNHAAEKAVPEAAAVLGDSVKQMTLADARTILTSTNNAATAYFRRTSETNLFARFLPIVRQATEQTGVTAAYKKLTEKASFGGLSLGSFLGQDTMDLDGYVTRKALDGLFLKIGQEEQRIRENPVARTTDLLQKVFGAVRQSAASLSPK